MDTNDLLLLGASGWLALILYLRGGEKTKRLARSFLIVYSVTWLLISASWLVLMLGLQ